MGVPVVAGLAVFGPLSLVLLVETTATRADTDGDPSGGVPAATPPPAGDEPAGRRPPPPPAS